MFTEFIRSSLSLPWLELTLLAISSPWLMFPEISPPLTTSAIILIVVSWTISYFRKVDGWWPRTLLGPLIFVFCLFVVQAYIVSVDKTLAFSKLTNLLLGIAGWRLIVVWNKSGQELPGPMKLISVVAAGYVVVGILGTAWVAKYSFFIRFVEPLRYMQSYLPVKVMVVHPNQFAGLLVMILPLVPKLIEAWLRPAIKRYFLSSIFIVFLFFLLLITQSRSAWLGAGAALMVIIVWLLLSHYDLRWKILLGAMLLVAIAISGVVVLPWVSADSVDIVSPLATRSFRLEVWRWSLVAISDFPWTGVGLGSFREVAPRLYPLQLPIDYDIAHGHNMFLQIALDIGLPGLICYLAIIILVFTTCYKLSIVNNSLSVTMLLCFASLLGFHIYGIADTMALGARTGLIFWLILGFVDSVAPNVRRRHVKENGIKRDHIPVKRHQPLERMGFS